MDRNELRTKALHMSLEQDLVVSSILASNMGTYYYAGELYELLTMRLMSLKNARLKEIYKKESLKLAKRIRCDELKRSDIVYFINTSKKSIYDLI